MNNGINTDPLFWQGAIDFPAAMRPPAQDGVAGVAAAPGPEADPCDIWLFYYIPTYNQIGPSCVGNGWANWIECMVRRYIDPMALTLGAQIDGEAIWKRGRELFWNGNMGGGLYLDQGFRAAVSLGWIPDTARLFRVPSDWDSVSRQLTESPLVQGHRIHKGWFTTDPANGCIDHAPAPDNTGAHCTMLAATLKKPDIYGGPRRWFCGLNSWGPDYGHNGLFVMSEAEWIEGAMTDMPWTAEIADFKAWRGWEKGVVNKG